jgi:hypothetical protein
VEGFTEEVEGFIKKTVKSFVNFAVDRIADILIPGAGHVISILRKIIGAVKAVAKGDGEVSVPLASFGGLELMVSVHVGSDSAGRGLPVGFIAPGDGGIREVDVAPEKDRDQAVIIQADLSWLSESNAVSRPGAMRTYTEQEVLPWLSDSRPDIRDFGTSN